MSPTRETSNTTGYASIMTPVHLGVGAEGPVKLAASLAGRFSSRLIGIAAEDIVLPYYGDGVVAVDAMMVESSERTAAENLAKAEAVFRRAAGSTNAIEWRAAIREPRGYVLTQSRAADLVVLARQGPSDESQSRMGISPGDLVMDLGRPILVVPPRVEFLSAKRIVIAWKDTREARRAVWDALPLLMRAEMVQVISIGPDAAEQGTEDVCDYLSKHHISARAVLRRDSAKYIVDEITDLAQQEGADLIVSGAYGHSRMREWMFGGVTHDLLETTPVCCLMSH